MVDLDVKQGPLDRRPSDGAFRARIRGIGTWLLATVVVVPILVVLQSVGSVPLGQALVISGVIAAQTLAGVLLWSWVRGERTVLWTEALAVGLPVGAVMALLTYQALLPLGLQAWGWSLPILVVVLAYLALGPTESQVLYPRRVESLALLVIGLAATGLAGRVWFTTPLTRDGWYALFGDIPIHEAMAETLGSRGPNESLMLLDGNLRYHWFADAWAGMLTAITDAAPFVALTRSLFAFAILGGALAAWTLAPMFIKGLWPRIGAGLAIFLGTTIIAGFANPGSPILEKFSPTITFGAVCLLALSFVMLRNITVVFRPWSLLPLVILAMGVLGGRITLAAVSAGGLGLLLLWSLVTRTRIRVTLVNIVAVGLGFLLTLAILTAPEPIGGQVNPWVFQPNIEAALLWSLIPTYSAIGYAAAVVAVIAVVTAQASGLLWTFTVPSGVRNPANYWVAGILVAGFLGVFLTRQLGYAQMTFLGSAIIPALAASGAGLGGALYYLRERAPSRSRWWWGCAVGLAAALLVSVIALAATPLLIGFRFYGPTQWSLPFLVWFSAFVLGVIVLAVMRVVRSRKSVLAAGVSMLVVITLTTPLWQIAQQIRTDPGTFGLLNANIMTTDDLAAAEWLRANTPEDGVWATNRMCSVVGETPPDCASTGYVVSALAGRQVLIEGHTYSIGGDFVERADEFSWAMDRVMNSYEFGVAPSEDSLQYLWDEGVRYFWVDTAVVHAESWEPFATPIFENPRATILRLNEPGAVLANS